MVQLYIIKSWMRIPSNNTFHYFLSIKCNNDKLLKVCRLTQIPDRRTIDRRFQNLPITQMISNMGNLFVSEKIVENKSASADGSLSLYEDILKRGRPYVYPTVLMVQLYIIKSWMRIPSNNTFHYFLSIKCNNDKLLKVCRLTQIPDRRTIDRRFQNLPITQMISNMGNLFVSEKIVENKSASADGSMLKAAGPVWHKSDMKNNRLPISGIDTDAKWGYSKSKGWVFGYKLHMSCSTGKLIVPLSANLSTANVHDSQLLHAS